ncbi:MAG: PLD nuclease N-terminal domain-containing protein [Anaerolineae bacterium]
MDNLLLVLAPLVVLQVGLMVLGYVDLARRERVRGGRKWVWALVMLISFVGPVLYFALGREE